MSPYDGICLKTNKDTWKKYKQLNYFQMINYYVFGITDLLK